MTIILRISKINIIKYHVSNADCYANIEYQLSNSRKIFPCLL